MLKNYLRITLRNFRRHKGYSFINIAGLATGLAAFAIIVLFVQNELSFDKHHENSADVYRMLLDADVMGQAVLTTASPAPMAATLMDEFPEVALATHIDDYSQMLVTVEDQQYYESDFFLADSTFFDIFTFPLVKGDPKTALVRPNTIVITEEIAEKYFGNDDPIGKTFNVDNRWDFEVTGVMRPVSRNSHFRPDLVGSWLTSSRANDQIWLNNSFYTYLRLQPGSDPAALEAKFPDLIRKYVGPQVEQMFGGTYDQAIAAGLKYDFRVERLTDIYLHPEGSDQLGPVGNIQYVYIMIVIGLFVLTIASINFMNLSTARASNRAREVGLRKVMGSDRKQLIWQFLGESMVMAFVSMILAVGLIFLVLPLFNSTAGTELTLAPWIFVTLVGVTAITGLLSGLYPAFVLSGFKPVTVLKGSFSSGSKGSFLRSSLVVFQFAISIALLIGTGVVMKQMDFVRSQDLGFDEEQVVVLPIETTEGTEGFDTFRSDVMQFTGVVDAAAASILPGPGHIHTRTVFMGEGAAEGDYMMAAAGEVTPEYFDALGMKLIAGRSFSRDYPSDVDAWVITESAAKEMGWTPEEAIEKLVTRPGANEDNSDRIGPVVGVMQDAHFDSFHTPMMPLIFGMRPYNRNYIVVRIEPARMTETLETLETRWTALEPGYPFRYFFLDQEYQRFYEQDARLGKIYSSFAGLALIIACLGLFGLASSVTAQRTKEIGIRKVMGASVSGIVMLLSREFTRLVLVSCVVAFPVAYFAMKGWLQNFAFATDIGWAVFVVSGLMAFAIALATVGYQSVRAAVADPVKALHHE